MAVVKSVEKDDGKSVTVNRTVSRCTYRVVVDGERKLFDLRTFGSEDRHVEGHASQIMQFEKESAKQLYEALRQVFDFD